MSLGDRAWSWLAVVGSLGVIGEAWLLLDVVNPLVSLAFAAVGGACLGVAVMSFAFDNLLAVTSDLIDRLEETA